MVTPSDAPRPSGPAHDPALHARRASSFGGQAAAYAEHRPDYPPAALEWALGAVLDGRPAGAALDVLDLGAGTGKLTAGVLALGHRVTAVEPDPAMLAELRARFPEVTALEGGAERIPLPDGSVDAVLVGQAFHWFDQDRALPEIARVLRPGGALGALWNSDDDRVEWIAELGRVASSRVSYRDWAHGKGVAPHPRFSPVATEDFPHVQRRTVDSLLATVATHSSLLVREPAARDAVLARVRALLESRPETSAGPFDLKLMTRVQRCVRAAD
jgi:SAM-dependent methyltransferase